MWNRQLHEWDIHPGRSLMSIEIQQWSELKSLLPSLNSSQGTDMPKWKLNDDGQFTIASTKEKSHPHYGPKR